jgi:hypothetical protein
LAQTNNYFFAVPLASRIHEGFTYVKYVKTNLQARLRKLQIKLIKRHNATNKDSVPVPDKLLVDAKHRKPTILDNIMLLIKDLAIKHPLYLVADAYYACGALINQLLDDLNHLITRVRTNTVAYEPIDTTVDSTLVKKRGRKKLYGTKVYFKNIFKDTADFLPTPSLVYDDQKVILQIMFKDLLWKPVGKIMRFVFVIHPTRGKIILLSSDLTLTPLEIIQIYCLRFKIEVAFKSTLYSIGTYIYHFWCKDMTPSKIGDGDMIVDNFSEKVHQALVRKMNAYQLFIQCGCIAHGILNLLSLKHSKLVWKHFGSWIRTIRAGVLPSEKIVQVALQNTLFLFLSDSFSDNILTKFIVKKIDPNRSEGLDILKRAKG